MNVSVTLELSSKSSLGTMLDTLFTVAKVIDYDAADCWEQTESTTHEDIRNGIIFKVDADGLDSGFWQQQVPEALISLFYALSLQSVESGIGANSVWGLLPKSPWDQALEAVEGFVADIKLLRQKYVLQEGKEIP